jgi:hypothetical protein
MVSYFSLSSCDDFRTDQGAADSLIPIVTISIFLFFSSAYEVSCNLVTDHMSLILDEQYVTLWAISYISVSKNFRLACFFCAAILFFSAAVAASR